MTVTPLAAAVQCRTVTLPEGSVLVRLLGGPDLEVVLLHDVAGSGADLLPWARRAAAVGDGVAVLDLPGHGGTAVPSGRDASADADVVARVLRQLGAGPFRLAGQGAGLEMARRLGSTFPDLVAVVEAVPGTTPAVPTDSASLTGSHLVESWGRLRRGSMFSPWDSADEDDRLVREAPRADDLTQMLVDRWEHAEPSGAVRSLFVETTAGPRVHVRVRGDLESGRPPIVLLPPAPGSGASVERLAGALAERRTVITVDYPGHGRSEPWDDDRTDLLDELPDEVLEGVVDVLESVRVDLGLAQVVAHGTHSGALLALLWARRSAAVHQVVLDGLPLPSPFAGWDLDAYLPDLTPDLAATHVVRAWEMATDKTLWSPWTDRTSETAVPLVAKDAQGLTAWVVDLLRGAASYRRLYRAVLSHELDETPLPGRAAVICRTAGDPLAATAGTAARLLPAGVVVDVPGTSTPSAVQVTARAVLDLLDPRPNDAAPDRATVPSHQRSTS